MGCWALYRSAAGGTVLYVVGLGCLFYAPFRLKFDLPQGRPSPICHLHSCPAVNTKSSLGIQPLFELVDTMFAGLSLRALLLG